MCQVMWGDPADALQEQLLDVDGFLHNSQCYREFGEPKPEAPPGGVCLLLPWQLLLLLLLLLLVGAASVPLLVRLRELHAPCVVSCTVPSSSTSVVGQGRKSPSVYVVSAVTFEVYPTIVGCCGSGVCVHILVVIFGEARPHLLIDVLTLVAGTARRPSKTFVRCTTLPGSCEDTQWLQRWVVPGLVPRACAASLLGY